MRAHAGVAVADITPHRPIALSGYASRTDLSSGTHDALTVRALAVDTSVLVTIDVAGLHEDMCARIQHECRTFADHVVVHATHTHGAPVSMPDRLGDGLDHEWVEGVVRSAVRAVESAVTAREPVDLFAAYGADPDVGENRRREGGPIDDALPVLTLRRTDGSVLATLVSYACHPVVLDADNLLVTADYPGAVRREIERQTGGTAIFATGCAGDVNTGHSADPTMTSTPTGTRTFAESERIGTRIAHAALSSGPTATNPNGTVPQHDAREASDVTGWSSRSVTLDLDVPTLDDLRAEDEHWTASAHAAQDGAVVLYTIWAQWARSVPANALSTWEAQVSVLHWGPVILVALPGEPFSRMAQQIRQELQTPDNVVIVQGYSNGSPGYFPTADEYELGGYEVCDAHRYYGMPGPFARGSAERLVTGALEAARDLDLPLDRDLSLTPESS